MTCNMEQLSVQTSGGYYSGFGYEQTESVHFEDLKQKQEALKTKTIELVKEFRLLQKMKKTTKGKQVADATSKEAGDKEEEDEDDDLDEGKLELTMRQQNFCETRQELMDSIRGWAKESSNQMAAFPSNRSKARAKRTVDFINMMKIYIQKTTPLGGEEEDETDQAWLDKYNEPLPEPDKLAAANSTFKDKLKAQNQR